ncbi:MAG: hypothetical protein ACYS7Y_31665 [Planctomycetota bacterium]
MMFEQHAGILTVRYTDGTEQRFEYAQAKENVNLAAMVEEALKSSQLVIELQDRMLVIPMQNIKMIEVSPAPSKLPRFVIRNAMLVGGQNY